MITAPLPGRRACGKWCLRRAKIGKASYENIHRAMYTSSRTWVSPKVKENGQRQQLNYARRKVCQKSPFWSQDFDLAQHRKTWEAGRLLRNEQKMAQESKLAEERRRQQRTQFPVSPLMRTAFDGKDFETIHSAVLCQETIFCPQWQNGKEIVAPWPNKAEMKYEGDDRISTDVLHGRCLGAPRVEGNETVNWQHRAMIAQFPFEDFHYPLPNAVDIFMRTHRIPELEFSDEEGEKTLGKDLMEMLDPQDQ